MIAALRPSTGTYFRIGNGGCSWPGSSGSTLFQPGTAATSMALPSISARSGASTTKESNRAATRRFMGKG